MANIRGMESGSRKCGGVIQERDWYIMECGPYLRRTEDVDSSSSLLNEVSVPLKALRLRRLP
jgi:hypothetical protein